MPPIWFYLICAADPKGTFRAIIHSLLFCGIAGTYVLIRLALLGENAEGSTIEGVIVLTCSGVLSTIIMKKFTRKK